MFPITLDYGAEASINYIKEKTDCCNCGAGKKNKGKVCNHKKVINGLLSWLFKGEFTSGEST